VSYAGGTSLTIFAWLALCLAVSGAIWLALNWPSDHDPMQDVHGDVTNMQDRR
jgi:hypothetical protein